MDGETQSEAILLVTGLVICILCVFFRDRRGCKLAAIVLMSVLVIAGVIIHIKGVFWDRKGADSFFSPQKVRKIEQQFLAKYDLIKDATPWRMDWDENGRKMNMLNNTVDKGSTYTYWSFLNSNLTSYLDMNGVINFPFETDALKDRYYLQSLNAVKYISANRQIDLEGYEKYNQNGEIVINNNSMSLARWYDVFLSETDYKALSYAERERAQAFCCIANEEIINKSSMESNCTSVKTQNTVDYSVESEGNGVSSNSIIINNPEEPLVYTFDCPAKGVLYFEIVGLVDCTYNVVIRAECNGVSQKAIHVAPTYRYYWGKNSYLFNMGYDEQSRKSLTLWFGQKGEYIFDNIKVEFTPYEEFADTMKFVKEEYDIDNITITDDAIVANVITDKTRIIYYSIPFSPGWKMYVDDEETPLFRANIMGIGAEIDAGEHRIILRYTPPYFGIGVLLAFVGLIGAITVLKYPSLFARKRRTKL